MSEPRPPRPVKIFFAILAAPGADTAALERRIEWEFGEIDLRLPPFPFTQTDYYEEEMGAGAAKSIVALKPLAPPDSLVDIKLHANRIEKHFARPDGARTLNIDPGYVDSSRVVLATGKDFAHRLYIGQGIYEELTLMHRRRPPGFEPLPWTYRDYKLDSVLRFFDRAREAYRAARKENS